MMGNTNDRLECWDPACNESFTDLAKKPELPLEVERSQTGLCGEAQSDGVPCTDPKRLCEKCGRAHH